MIIKTDNPSNVAKWVEHYMTEEYSDLADATAEIEVIDDKTVSVDFGKSEEMFWAEEFKQVIRDEFFGRQ